MVIYRLFVSVTVYNNLKIWIILNSKLLIYSDYLIYFLYTYCPEYTDHIVTYMHGTLF